MIGALMGVPGKCKAIYDHLTTYLTAAIAGRIDAAISTRADASVWTPTLATELDGLAPAIAALPTTFLRSVQTGRVAVSSATSGTGEDRYYTDATITAVLSISKCFVLWYPTMECVNGPFTLRLTSTTNLRIGTSNASATSIYGRWYVIEFY